MTAAALNITIEQGASFNHVLTWTEYDATAENNAGDPIDLTSYTARMHIRKKKNSTEYLIELTTENGRISLGGVTGQIILSISAADTEALNFTDAVYDLELVTGSNVVRLVEGTVTLSKEVTRT